MRSELLVILMAFHATSSVLAAPPRAARSVHLQFGTPAGDIVAFYNELTIEQSTRGSYFMACGFAGGYFGVQELVDGKKVAIFSVWDPTKGDDPQKVAQEHRVRVLDEGEGTRIKRFGGEGTGAQCMMDFDWKIVETIQFCITASPIENDMTAFTAFLFDRTSNNWKRLATFATTQKPGLRGLYSFIEDFRRDEKSANEIRRARFGNAWVCDARGNWQMLDHAKFTASSAEWEAKDTIDAGVIDHGFYLQTGGKTESTNGLNSSLKLAEDSPTTAPSLPEKMIPTVPSDKKK